MEWEQDISMFDWFFTPNNTSSKVIAITIGTIKYCYNIYFNLSSSKQAKFNQIKRSEALLFWIELALPACWVASSASRNYFFNFGTNARIEKRAAPIIFEKDEEPAGAAHYSTNQPNKTKLF